VVEVARLESVYRVKPIGGSNPPLSAKTKERAARWAAFSFWRREASRLRGLRGGFEGSRLPARPSPNRPTAVRPRANCAARRGRALYLLIMLYEAIQRSNKTAQRSCRGPPTGPRRGRTAPRAAGAGCTSNQASRKQSSEVTRPRSAAAAVHSLAGARPALHAVHPRANCRRALYV
jgi:hypothetical protein